MTTDTAEAAAPATASAAVPSAATPPVAKDNGRALVFEQPLNERMRTFLRLDFLYNQALYHNETGSPWGSRAAMASLIDILAVISRSDLRSDALKEIERQLHLLSEYQSRPGVDTQRLKTFISNLGRLRADLMNAGVACQQPLRDSEFLNAIKHRSSIPGGTCEFDLPDYLYWLSEPDEARMHAFNQWLGLLRPLCDAVAELLWLTRQFGRTRQECARGGTFTITFDRDNPLQLLRIVLPAASGLYPEVSGSHHRCSVRFLTWKGLTERAAQTNEDVTFQLTACA
ncbi:MAG: cell division protein ZapD [Steroidobacteraceae bacterium]